MSLLRRIAAGLTHSGPGYDLPHQPRRGDDVEGWLRAQRDQYQDGYGRTPGWRVLDAALDQYRLHADTRTPPGEHACSGPHCECLEAAT